MILTSEPFNINLKCNSIKFLISALENHLSLGLKNILFFCSIVGIQERICYGKKFLRSSQPIVMGNDLVSLHIGHSLQVYAKEFVEWSFVKLMYLSAWKFGSKMLNLISWLPCTVWGLWIWWIFVSSGFFPSAWCWKVTKRIGLLA